MEIGPILVDTNGYSAFKRGEEGALEIIRAAPGIILNPVILGELLSGYAFGGKKEKNTEELESFLVSQRVQLVPIDGETSRYYAEIYRELRQKGNRFQPMIYGLQRRQCNITWKFLLMTGISGKSKI